MATVNWHGQEFPARPIERVAGGWLMEAQAHGHRFCPGTTIEVRDNEIVHMDDSEIPAPGAAPAAAPPAPDASASQAALEAAMAEERAALPPATELIAAYQKNAQAVRKSCELLGPKASPPGAGVTITVEPDEPAEKGNTMADLAGAAERIKALKDKINANSDALMAKLDDIEKRADAANAKAGAVVDQQVADVAALEQTIAQLSNVGG